MAWPPPVLPINRSDSTPQQTTHPQDHNAANLAINDLVAEATRIRSEGFQAFSHIAIQSTTTGLFEIGNSDPGVRPYNTQMTVWAMITFGSTSVIWAKPSLWLNSSAIAVQTAGPQASEANVYTSAPINWSWNVPAGQPTSFKTRLELVAFGTPGSTCIFEAGGVYQIRQTN